MTTIVATFGDLAESLLKRSVGVKDSGNIMPGHGGFLDRFDAYLLAVPFVSLMLWIFVKIDAVILLIKYMG
jgi:phosphatidate cytidylyltransferase